MPFKDKEVAKEYRREYYLKNKEKQVKQARENYYKNHEKRKKQKKVWAECNVDKLREYRKQYAPAYRERKRVEQKARWTVHNAIRYGKIIKPEKCSDCGVKENLHAHHEDYSKPLDVDWLCHQCHFKRHRRETCFQGKKHI